MQQNIIAVTLLAIEYEKLKLEMPIDDYIEKWKSPDFNTSLTYAHQLELIIYVSALKSQVMTLTFFI